MACARMPAQALNWPRRRRLITQAISKRIAQLTMSDDGSLKGRITLAWEGQEALGHRLGAFKTDEAGRKKGLEDERTAIVRGSATVKCDSAKAWEESAAPHTAVVKS